MSLTTGPARLRQEAEPKRWDELTEAQQRVAKWLVDLLHDAYTRLLDRRQHADRQDAWRFPKLGIDRPSRMALLDGERGVGKTTALLSLIQMLSDPDTHARDLESPMKGHLEQLSQNVIVLEALDLEPFPDRINLLASILVRIDRAMSRWLDSHQIDSQHSSFTDIDWMGGAAAAHESYTSLAQDICVAWEGMPVELYRGLEPEDYAAELRRVERARLGANERITEYLDGLARKLAYGQGVKDALFVLPVDDVDLAPSHTLDLLRIMRMISAPRLFFMVLGDMDMVERVTLYDVASDLSATAGSATKIPGRAVRGDIINTAQALSHAKLRKLIPQSQRLKIHAQSVSEALSFSPHRGGRRDAPSLAALLKRIPVDDALTPMEAEPLTLQEFWGVSEVMEESQRRPEYLSWYSPIRMLKATPRQNYDFYIEINDVAQAAIADGYREDVAPWLIARVARHALSLVRVDRFLTPELRDVLEATLSQDPTTADWRFKWGQVHLGLNLTPAGSFAGPDQAAPSSKGKKASSEAPPESGPTVERIHVSTAGEHRLLRGLGDDVAGQEIMMMGRTRYALLATHDLIAHLDPTFGSENEWGMPFVIDNIDGLARVQWSDGVNSVTIPWDPPAFYSVRDLDRFLMLWNNRVHTLIYGRSRSRSGDVEALSALATAFVVASAGSILPVRGPGSDGWEEQVNTKDMFLRFRAELDDSRLRASPTDASISPAYHRYRMLFARMLFLLCPECGLPTKTAVSLLKRILGNGIGGLANLGPDVRKLRLETYRRFVGAGMTQLAKAVFLPVFSAGEMVEAANNLYVQILRSKAIAKREKSIQMIRLVLEVLRDIIDSGSHMVGHKASEALANLDRVLSHFKNWTKDGNAKQPLLEALQQSLRQAEAVHGGLRATSDHPIASHPAFALTTDDLRAINPSGFEPTSPHD